MRTRTLLTWIGWVGASLSLGGCYDSTLGAAVCEEGDEKPAEDGCNTCRCQEDGVWACTEADCDTPTECEPGDTKPSPAGCGECTCNEDGVWACTEADCDTPTECEPGDTKPSPDGCGGCTCNEDGTWGCIDIGCDTPTECEPGDTKPSPDGCGGCTCNEDGTWGCIDIGCDTPTECEPGDSMLADNGCSTCTCQDDGTWTCTQPECGVPGECEPGDTMPTADVCTTCICSAEAIWSCTDNGCAECAPGETRSEPETCTTCTCSDEGAWSCRLDDDCTPSTCPEPRDIPAGLDCVAAEAVAKNPDTGECCSYETPCAVPEGWEYYDTEVECTAVSAPVCPEPVAYEGECSTVVAWAADPETGVCCQYGTPCNAPSGWRTYDSDSECLAAQHSAQCETGDSDYAILGARNSFNECGESCRSDLQITPDNAGCSPVALTVFGWTEAQPTWTNTGLLTPSGNGLVYSLAYGLRGVALDATYNCPDCADGGAGVIILRRGGVESSHTYDISIGPPEVLEEADAFVQSVLSALSTCASNELVEVDLDTCQVDH